MRVRIGLCVFLVCLCVSLFAQDEPAKVFSWVGGTGRVLDGDKAIEIPVELGGDAPNAPDLRQVTRDGVELNRKDSFAVAYDAQNREIVITPRAGAKTPGTYVLHLAVTTPKIAKAQMVDVTLTRPTAAKAAKKEPELAQFQIDSSLYVERIIDIPWLRTRVGPEEWIVRETGGKSAMTPTTAEVLSPIFSKKSKDLGQLKTTFPSVQPSSDARAKLSFSGNDPWIGEANAKVFLQSRSLARNPLFTVVVRSRFSYVWLFLAILAGVRLGWFVKKTLETRGAVLAVKLLAAGQVEKAQEYEKRIADKEVRKQLGAQRKLLEEMIGRVAATADEVKAVVDAVKPRLEAIAKKADEDRAAAGKKLDDLRAAIGRPERQSSPLNSDVRAATTDLDAQERAIQEGEITLPLKELANIEKRVIRDVAEDLPSWRSPIASGVEKLRGWHDLEKVVNAIDAKLTALATPKTREELTTTLDATAEISARLRNDIAEAGIDDVYATIQYVIEQLGTTDALQTAAHEVSGARHADLPRELGKVAEAVQRAHDALSEAIVAAYRTAKPDAMDKPEGLDTGDFRKAVGAVVTLSQMKTATDFLSSVEIERELQALPTEEAIPPTSLVPLDEGIPRPMTEEQIARELRLVNEKRDLIYAALIIIGGFIIFRSSFVGTIEDFAAAFLWGFSVDLTSATLSSYASPLLARRPFKTA